MRLLRLYSMREVRYVLLSMARWNNDVGHQARHLLYWYKRGWLHKRDLFATTQSLIEQAEAYNLLSRRDIIRLIAYQQLKDLTNAMKVYPTETSNEEAVATFMLTAKETNIDVEKSIALYLTYKEEHEKEMEEWRGKMELLDVKPRKKLSGYARRMSILETRRRLAEKRQRLKVQKFVDDKILTKPWEEERKEVLELPEKKEDDDGTSNKD